MTAGNETLTRGAAAAAGTPVKHAIVTVIPRSQFRMRDIPECGPIAACRC
jgi:hypothetical protein